MRSLLAGFLLLCFLPSCEFSCTVGETDEKKAKSSLKNGVRTRNEINLQTAGVNVEKAYLIFDDGEMVPEDNIIDFSKTVKLVLKIDGGWKETAGKVELGASEKILVENRDVLLDEKDLFAGAYPEGMPADDARVITLSASIRAKSEIRPLTTFNVFFRVWDKNSDAFIAGDYKLFAR